MEILIIFRCPKIYAHYNLFMMCLIMGHLKSINFPFGTNGKLMVLGVPILKHFRVDYKIQKLMCYEASYTD